MTIVGINRESGPIYGHQIQRHSLQLGREGEPSPSPPSQEENPGSAPLFRDYLRDEMIKNFELVLSEEPSHLRLGQVSQYNISYYTHVQSHKQKWRSHIKFQDMCSQVKFISRRYTCLLQMLRQHVEKLDVDFQYRVMSQEKPLMWKTLHVNFHFFPTPQAIR